MTLWKTALIAIALIGLALVALVAIAIYGKRSWQQATETLYSAMEASRKPPATTRFDPKELEGLPPVVVRFFNTALTPGAPVVTSVRLTHTGTFNMGETDDKWLPFQSLQRVTTSPPAFTWDGRVRMLPAVDVYVHDAYVNREGLLHPSILGVIDLMLLRGKGEIADGEFMRYFAESAWYPTALLPSQGVRWRAVDERRAEATLSDGEVSATVTFTFGNDGLIESVRANARGRTVGKSVVPTPWEGRWFDYELRNGMRVPRSGEVAWITPTGPKPYWRGTIASIEYEFAR